MGIMELHGKKLKTFKTTVNNKEKELKTQTKTFHNQHQMQQSSNE